MAGPVGQFGNIRLDSHQNVDNLGERVVQLSQKVRDVLQLHEQARTRLDNAQRETERLRPIVVKVVTAAGGCVGFVVSRVLGAAGPVIAVATVGTGLVSYCVSYYFTK